MTTGLLILGGQTAATAQMGMPAAYSGPDSKTEKCSSVEQCEKGKRPQVLAPALRALLTAKTVLVVGDPPELYPTGKAEEAFKKALATWGRYQLVDDAETADIIIVITEYSSSKPKRLERISENVAIFVGGHTPNVDATPLWAVKELGPVLGQRPTGKLVGHLRKYVTELEESVAASPASKPT